MLLVLLVMLTAKDVLPTSPDAVFNTHNRLRFAECLHLLCLVIIHLLYYSSCLCIIVCEILMLSSLFSSLL